MQDKSTNNHDQPDEHLADLMRRADNKEVLNDEDLATLASHGRCPDCGRTPDAEPGFIECELSGFHQDTADAASDGSPDDDTSDASHDNNTVDGSSDPYTPSDAARSYIDRGWAPLPLKQGTKEPRDTNWQNTTYTPDDFGDVDNVGLNLGPASNYLVDVDLDYPEAVRMASAFLQPTNAVFGRPSKPDSHFMYTLSPEDDLRRVFYQDPDGSIILEMRGEAHQTMVPPSIHPDREPLAWSDDGDPAETTLEDLQKRAGWLAAASMLGKHWQDWPHQHHFIAMSLSGGLLRAGIPKDTVKQFLKAVCILGGDDDWEDKVKAVDSTADKLANGDDVSGFPKLAEQIGDAYVKKLFQWLKLPKKDATDPGPTDTGNAERLIDQHGDDLRYCDGFRVWDETQWVRDDRGKVMEFAKDTARSIFDEAKNERDHTKAQQLAKHAASSLNLPRLKAMAETAKTDPRISVAANAFDRDPWLFNVQNGTINLRTGGLQPHDRDDLITRLAPVPYDPEATCPTWDAFLLRSTGGDQATVDHLQRVIGYMLTGLTVEQVMFILYGNGENGKSKLIEALERLFGDYALKIPTGTLMHKRGEQGAPTDLAQLPGARLVVANETSQGGQLDEALVKDMTGGDRLVGRHLYHAAFQFDPTHKLLLYGNHLPIIRGTDHGIWRRIRLIPFNATISESERDPYLGDKLAKELPGILAWAVQGCLKWRREGLGNPARVQGATADYRSDMDTLGRFLEECTEAQDKVRGADLYDAYAAWTKASGEYALSTRVFGTELTRRGIGKLKTNGTLYRTGIRLNRTGEKYRTGWYRVPIDLDEAAS
jgi:putative DNA primase/helicase